MKRAFVLLLALTSVATVLTMACSDDDDSGQGGSDSDEGTTIRLTAQDTMFTTQLLGTGPNREVTFVFDNQSSNVHGVAFSRTELGTNPFFEIEPAAGPITRSVPLTTPDVGTYTFFCQIHPEALRGELVVVAPKN